MAFQCVILSATRALSQYPDASNWPFRPVNGQVKRDQLVCKSGAHRSCTRPFREDSLDFRLTHFLLSPYCPDESTRNKETNLSSNELKIP
jgi:hypothetical protein